MSENSSRRIPSSTRVRQQQPIPEEASASNKPAAAGQEQIKTSGKGILDLNPANLLQGVILSEVLGKPKAKRKGPW